MMWAGVYLICVRKRYVNSLACGMVVGCLWFEVTARNLALFMPWLAWGKPIVCPMVAAALNRE